MLNRKNNKRIPRCGLFVVCLCTAMICLLFSQQAMAVDASKQEGQAQSAAEKKKPSKEEVLAELLKNYFTYERENRSDPFVSFVKKEPKKVAGKDKIDTEEEVLTGMQLFEPGQLTLVSIIFAGDRALAMVQDSGGKGYVIEKGTLLGRTGVVESVQPNVVMIKQWSLSISGQKKYKTIEMVLRKEGE